MSKSEKEEDVKNLSNRAESRAEQLAVANAVDSVKNKLEQTGAVNTTLGDGRFKKIVAPVKKEASEETSPTKIKARVHGDKADEGRTRQMVGYKTKQLVTSLSDKAEMNEEQKKLSETNRKTVSAKGLAKVLSAKAEAYLEKAKKSETEMKILNANAEEYKGQARMFENGTGSIVIEVRPRTKSGTRTKLKFESRYILVDPG